VVIPENYGKDTALTRQTRVMMIVDGSNMVYATNATSAMLSVTRTLSAQTGVKTLVARGIQPDQAAAAYQSVEFSEEAWFNPTLNYAYFVVLALALNIWQQCCTLAATMNIIGETGAASWQLIKSFGISRLRLFISKSAAQIIMFMAIALPLFWLAFAVFKLPLRCGLPLFFLFNLAFATALHSVGTLASSIARDAVTPPGSV
jgi:ABC-2 type transport system permease protein